MPMRHERSSLPVPTLARMCGWATMPISPFNVSITIVKTPTSPGVTIESMPGSRVSRMPVKPPVSRRPIGISRKLRAMMNRLWTKSV